MFVGWILEYLTEFKDELSRTTKLHARGQPRKHWDLSRGTGGLSFRDAAVTVVEH